MTDFDNMMGVHYFVEYRLEYHYGSVFYFYGERSCRYGGFR